MEHIPASTIKGDEVIRFQLSLSFFKVVTTDHLETLYAFFLFYEYCRFDIY